MARTTRAFSISLTNPNEPIIGIMMEAVVMSDTVDEPWAVLIAAASRNGSQRLRLISVNVLPSRSAMPEFCSTLPKMPPAPVIKMIEAAGGFLQTRFDFGFGDFRIRIDISFGSVFDRKNQSHEQCQRAENQSQKQHEAQVGIQYSRRRDRAGRRRHERVRGGQTETQRNHRTRQRDAGFFRQAFVERRNQKKPAVGKDRDGDKIADEAHGRGYTLFADEAQHFFRQGICRAGVFQKCPDDHAQLDDQNDA